MLSHPSYGFSTMGFTNGLITSMIAMNTEGFTEKIRNFLIYCSPQIQSLYKFQIFDLLFSIFDYQSMIILQEEHYCTYFAFFKNNYIPYARQYNPLLISNRSWILTIHKARIFKKKAPWKNVFGLQKVGKKYTNRGL